MPADLVARAWARQSLKADKNYYLVDVDVNEAIATTVENILNIETYTTGTAQVETVTAVGTVTANPGGNATVTVTAANMTGSPKAVSVALLLNDDANAIASKIRAELEADETVNGFFVVSGDTDKVILTARTPARNDITMNIAIAAGTATGVTAVATSVNTTKGSKNEIVHPSILFFPNGWNGYKYWLGYTCFDNGDSQYENPCIAVSNDNENWTTPPGLTNPIEPKPASGYHADINLFMSPDEKTMYMVFKYSGTTKITYLRSSIDGVNWTEKVALFENVFEDVSPAVVWDGTQYKMWTVKHADTPNNIYLRTADNATGPWSEPVLCTYTLPSSKEAWHMDVRKAGNQYHMLLHEISGYGEHYFGKSQDGLNWVFGTNALIYPRGQDVGVNYSFYKSTMFPMQTPEGLKYGLWYNSATPYYVCYSEIRFDRSKLINDCNNNVLQAYHGLSPWIFCDTFNRADTTGGLGTSDSGHAWTSVLGNVMGVSDNKAYLPVAANSRSVVDLGVANFYAEITLLTSAMGHSGYLIFRYIDTTNLWRVGHGNTSLTLQKIVDGVLTPIAVSPRLVAGDRLGVECNGNSIKIYINGLLKHSLTDAANNTGTKIGLTTDNTTARFDNLIARSL